jgi:uncharacterized Zn finger protein
MTDDQIFCPACDIDTDHAVVKSGRENLVRCLNCGTAHPLQREKERLANVKVIINRDGLSQPYHITLPTRQELKVGSELLVDDPARNLVLTKITSLETDRRLEKVTAGEVKTIWARAIDDVTLKVSIYKDGITHPVSTTVCGNDSFSRGDVLEIDGKRFEVTKIKFRGEGFVDSAEAKDILRIWGREL